MDRSKTIAVLLLVSLLFCGCSYFEQEAPAPTPAVEAEIVQQVQQVQEETVEFDGNKLGVTPAPSATPTPAASPQSVTRTVYGYTVKFTLPASWAASVTMEATDEHIRFVHSDSAAYGGLLMLFYFNDIGENDPAFIALGQIDGYEYGYALPMDAQFDPAKQAQYESLAAQIEEVTSTITVSGAEGDSDMIEQQTHPVGNYLVTFNMPQGWEDVRVEVHETSISFYHIPSESNGGLLFIFVINPIGTSEPAFEPIGQIDSYEYGYVLPMDVQFPPSQQAAYETLQSQVVDVVNTVYVR